MITEAKKEKEKKIVFVETDPQEAFPQNTIEALIREIRNLAKDLTVDWPSTITLLHKAFENLSIPVPSANQKARWEQYRRLIKQAVESLRDSRGFAASWSIL